MTFNGNIAFNRGNVDGLSRIDRCSLNMRKPCNTLLLSKSFKAPKQFQHNSSANNIIAGALALKRSSFQFYFSNYLVVTTIYLTFKKIFIKSDKRCTMLLHYFHTHSTKLISGKLRNGISW